MCREEGIHSMKKEPKAPGREGIEPWLDERVRLALDNFTHPFESRIRQMRKRVEKLQSRIQNITLLLEQDPDQRKPSNKTDATEKS